MEDEGYATTKKSSKKKTTSKKTSTIVDKSSGEEFEYEQDIHAEDEVDPNLGDGDTRVVEDTKDSDPEPEPESDPEPIQAIDHYIAPVDEEITYLPYQSLKNGMAQNYKQVAGMADVQEALKEDGFYKGPINGHATKETVEAFARFQDSLGRFPNGVPTIADLEELGFGVVT